MRHCETKVMNTKNLVLFLILFSTYGFSQNSDTVFIKKETGHKIYKIQNRSSDLYNDISNFKEFETDHNEKISQIGLNSSWIRIHKYDGKYFLYGPCDWCNNTRLQIGDNFMQIRGCELTTYKIISAEKINQREYKITYVALSGKKRKTVLKIKEINSEYNIYEFSYSDGIDLSKMLFIKDSDYKNFDIINNECKNEKSIELKFEE